MGQYVFSAYYGHDASIAIVGEGKILHYEVERFTREKHGRWPDPANYNLDILYRMALNDLGISDEEVVAIAGIGCANDFQGFRSRSCWDEDISILEPTMSDFLGATRPCVYLAHHLAHAAYGFFTSPYEHARVIAIDGGGDAYDLNGTPTIIDTTTGVFRQAFNSSIIEKGFRVHDSTCIGGSWDILGHRMFNRWLQAGTLMAMVALDEEGFKLAGFGSKERAEVLGWQDKTTQCFHDLYGEGDPNLPLILTGGVALNGIAVYDLLSKTAVPGIHVPPAVHDGGITVGAAMAVLHWFLGRPRDRYNIRDIAFAGNNIQGTPDINAVVSDLVANRIVMVAHGKAESGPRALGNRSILALPDVPLIQQLINRCKSRQFFRPVAPVVRAEDLDTYFVAPKADLTSYDYMTQIVEAKPGTREIAPGGLHIDGSARIQVVHPGHFLHDVLTRVKDAGRVPILLNTSFNNGGEAMVNTEAHAHRSFLTMPGGDVLYVGSNTRSTK